MGTEATPWIHPQVKRFCITFTVTGIVIAIFGFLFEIGAIPTLKSSESSVNYWDVIYPVLTDSIIPLALVLMVLGSVLTVYLGLFNESDDDYKILHRFVIGFVCISLWPEISHSLLTLLAQGSIPIEISMVGAFVFMMLRMSLAIVMILMPIFIAFWFLDFGLFKPISRVSHRLIQLSFPVFALSITLSLVL